MSKELLTSSAVRGFVLLAPIVLVASLTHSQSSATNGAPAQSADPKELMLQAAKASSIITADVKPWHLKASYLLYDDKGEAKDQGAIEEFWVAPDKYKVTTTGQGFSQTDYGTNEGIRRAGQKEPLATMLVDARHELESPLPPLQTIANTGFTLQTKQAGNSILSCVQPGTHWYGMPLMYCLAGNPSQPRIIVYSNTGLQTLRNRMFRFDDRWIAGDIAFKESGKTLLTLHVDLLEHIAAIDDAVLAPSPDASLLPRKVSVSAGVSQGMLLRKVAPDYPPIAQAAGVSGTVVLEATINSDGHITKLQVVSGPPMLCQAAIDAVRQWQYRPYLINGQPVEVITTINVVFALGNKSSGQRVEQVPASGFPSAPGSPIPPR